MQIYNVHDCAVAGSIMLYLGETYNKFIPTEPLLRPEMMNWLFWQMSNLGPMVGACFGHFFCYAPGML